MKKERAEARTALSALKQEQAPMIKKFQAKENQLTPTDTEIKAKVRSLENTVSDLNVEYLLLFGIMCVMKCNRRSVTRICQTVQLYKMYVYERAREHSIISCVILRLLPLKMLL